jgi:hypothetical protein
MSNLGDIADGIVTTLSANMSGVQKVFDHPPDTINAFPSVAVLIEDLDPTRGFGGNSFQVTVRLVVLVASGDDQHGFDLLYDIVDPTATTGIKYALEQSNSLNSTCDGHTLQSIENINRRELWGGFYFAADFVLDVWKTVA